MTVKWFIVIVFAVILFFSIFIQIRNYNRNDKLSRTLIFVLDGIIVFMAFAVPLLLPNNIANTKIKYINGHVTIDQPAKADESTLSIDSFQLTGDSVNGVVGVKFHISSNFYLLNGKITIYRGGNLDPVIVGYSIPSSTCLSGDSKTGFGIKFSEMESGQTYWGEIVAEDISGKVITKSVEFTAY